MAVRKIRPKPPRIHKEYSGDIVEEKSEVNYSNSTSRQKLLPVMVKGSPSPNRDQGLFNRVTDSRPSLPPINHQSSGADASREVCPVNLSPQISKSMN